MRLIIFITLATISIKSVSGLPDPIESSSDFKQKIRSMHQQCLTLVDGTERNECQRQIRLKYNQAMSDSQFRFREQNRSKIDGYRSEKQASH